MSGKFPFHRFEDRGQSALRVAAAAALGLAVCTHLGLLISFLPADPANHSDEASHFVTGVMVHDYLRAGIPADPMAFAKGFYSRYPKVAMGHWPPAFYAVEAGWFLLAGVSVASARLLCVLTMFACCALLGAVAARIGGAVAGMIAAILFLSAPVILRSAPLIMSDCAVTILMVAAALLLEWAIRSGRTALWMGFAGVASVAILTKGTAWALGLTAVVLPFFLRNAKTNSFAFSQRLYWAAGFTIVVCSAPFYLWALRLHIGYPIASVIEQPAGGASMAAMELHRRIKVLGPILSGDAAPWYVLTFAIAGFGVQFLPMNRRWSVGVPASVAGIFGQVALQMALPSTLEPRYYVPSLAFCILLTITAMARLPRRMQFPAATILIAACSYQLWAVDVVIPVSGYQAAIPEIPSGAVTLVVSDANGEGAVIARFLERDHARRNFILRGSKVLAESRWDGAHYRLRCETPAAVESLLQRTAVSRVLIEEGLVRAPAHIALCQTALDGMRSFRPEGTYAIRKAGAPHARNLRLYRRIDLP